MSCASLRGKYATDFLTKPSGDLRAVVDIAVLIKKATDVIVPTGKGTSPVGSHGGLGHSELSLVTAVVVLIWQLHNLDKSLN